NRVWDITVFCRIRLRFFHAPWLLIAWQASDPKDIYLRFKTLAQAQIVSSHLVPTSRLLIEVQSSPDLYDPAVIQTDFTVMNVRIELDLQLNIQLQQTL